jgi:hypothetical protein
VTPHSAEASAMNDAPSLAVVVHQQPVDQQSDEARPVAVPVENAERRSVLGELPLAVAIAGAGLGLVIIALHHFRWGNMLVAGSMLAAALVRLVLPTRQAGLLVVRSRLVDVVTMSAMGGALLVLALVTRT